MSEAMGPDGAQDAELVELGSVSELTRGVGGPRPDHGPLGFQA